MVGDRSLAELTAGDLVDLVIQVSAHVGKGSTFTALWHQEAGLLLDERLTLGTWTLYGYQVCDSTAEHGVLCKGKVGSCFRKQEVDASSFTKAVEVCAGIGGFSLGLHAAGGHTKVFADKCAIACQTLELNHARVIHGDIASDVIARRLHEAAADEACILAAGVPCQGYSPQGLGLGFRDPRSKVLLSVLQLAWRMQSCGLILECVAEIQDSQEAMAALLSFADRMAWTCHQLVFDLSAQWASRRRRWWCVMVPRHLPSLSLQAWPEVQPTVTVGQVIPEWP